MNFLKKLFGHKEPLQKDKEEFSEEEYKIFDEQKSEGLEYVLGKCHNIVGHAIIPFDTGGAVDMYYFPNGIEGTGFATMELIAPNDKGPVPNQTGTYKLVAFTRLAYSDLPESLSFNLIERRICSIFTSIGSYSFNAKLEPLETCEIPQDNRN